MICDLVSARRLRLPAAIGRLVFAAALTVGLGLISMLGAPAAWGQGLDAGPGLTPMPVQGAQPCGERGQIISRLEGKYGETQRGYGLQRGEAVVEVYASEATGTWTILLSMPNGLACLMAAGENWAVPELSEAVQGDPT